MLVTGEAALWMYLSAKAAPSRGTALAAGTEDPNFSKHMHILYDILAHITSAVQINSSLDTLGRLLAGLPDHNFTTLQDEKTEKAVNPAHFVLADDWSSLKAGEPMPSTARASQAGLEIQSRR